MTLIKTGVWAWEASLAGVEGYVHTRLQKDRKLSLKDRKTRSRAAMEGFLRSRGFQEGMMTGGSSGRRLCSSEGGGRGG